MYNFLYLNTVNPFCTFTLPIKPFSHTGNKADWNIMVLFPNKAKKTITIVLTSMVIIYSTHFFDWFIVSMSTLPVNIFKLFHRIFNFTLINRSKKFLPLYSFHMAFS